MKTWQCLLLGWLCAKVIRFAGVVTWSAEWWAWVGICAVGFGLTLCAVDGWRTYRKSDNESQSPATRQLTLAVRRTSRKGESMLFKMIELPSDESVQFVGVYVLKWGRVDEPTVAFREATPVEIAAEQSVQLTAAGESASGENSESGGG